MEKSILDALKRVVDGQEPEVYERRRTVILMNERRQDILRYLCSHPCSHFRKIARDMKLANRNLQFHLDKLAEGRYVSARRAGNRVIYYPADMLAPANIGLRAFLNEDESAKIFSLVMKMPGISQGEASVELGIDRQKARKTLTGLQGFGLIGVIKDGRFSRYYPSEGIPRLLSSQRKQSRTFRRTLVRIMRTDGVNPQIVRLSENEMHVKVLSGRRKRVLFITINSFRDIQ